MALIPFIIMLPFKCQPFHAPKISLEAFSLHFKVVSEVFRWFSASVDPQIWS